MAMSFFNAHNTTLFSSQWTPSTAEQYVGTCIFLVVLAIVACMLTAYRHILEAKWRARDVSSHCVTVANTKHGDAEKGGALRSIDGAQEISLEVGGVEERVRVVAAPPNAGIDIQAWRFDTDLPRACIFTVQAGVGYLL
jgi:hypothetical protein